MMRSRIEHPYKKHEGTPNWALLSRAIDDLVANGDLEEKTNRVYVVGYLCQALSPPEKNKS
jgi:hypothetical protein